MLATFRRSLVLAASVLSGPVLSITVLSITVLSGVLIGCTSTDAATVADAVVATDVVACVPESCPAVTPRTTTTGAPAEPYGFRIGTNPPTTVDFAAFDELSDNTDVSVVLGGQGAYMVVVAAATDAFNCCVTRVNIKADLSSPDGTKVYGHLQYKKRPMTDLEGGVRYLPNVWLVIGQPDEWRDQPAILLVEMEPYGGGTVVSKQVHVTLREANTRESTPVDPPPAR